MNLESLNEQYNDIIEELDNCENKVKQMEAPIIKKILHLPYFY